jgi:multidrug efflux system outer membrane protein
VIAAIGDRRFRSTRTAATPTLDGAFDIDLWGRLAQGRAAARADRQAAGSDVATARLLIGAETARAYLALRAAQADHDAALERRQAAARALALVSRRADQGAGLRSLAAVRQLDLQRADDAVSAAQEAADLQSARLADLTGQPAVVLAGGEMITPGPAQWSAPSGVVDRRPDVQAAYARLVAADARRAQAIAASRPDFQIALALGSPDAAIATLLDVKALAWAAAASFSHAIFDGGARRAAAHTATAEADLADIAYRQAVLKAWSEVRVAGAEEAQARRRLAAETTAATVARTSLAASQARHAQGAADGLDLVQAQVALLDASQTERQARLQLGEAHVQRLLAMGGG